MNITCCNNYLTCFFTTFNNLFYSLLVYVLVTFESLLQTAMVLCKCRWIEDYNVKIVVNKSKKM